MQWATLMPALCGLGAAENFSCDGRIGVAVASLRFEVEPGDFAGARQPVPFRGEAGAERGDDVNRSGGCERVAIKPLNSG